MAEFIDQRKQVANQQQQQQHQSSSQDKKDLFKNVPDLVEEKRKDLEGNYNTINKYAKGIVLGKGGFAQVYISTNIQTREKYALKIVAKSSLTKPRARLKLQTEIKIHRALNHSNIVRFERFFEDSNYAYLVLELCSNNSMSDLLNTRKRVTEFETRYYLYQLVNSLQYLHRHLVIHRDLKLGNLFIDNDMKLKVGDFGLAAKLENETERRMTVCGTPNYIAPELLEGKKGHSFEVDVWSTGVVMYTLLVGKPPYQSKDVKSTYKRILANAYSYPETLILSAESKSLISRMLELKPENRASLQEILDHPFMSMSHIPHALPPSAMKIPYDETVVKLAPGNENMKPMVNRKVEKENMYMKEVAKPQPQQQFYSQPQQQQPQQSLPAPQPQLQAHVTPQPTRPAMTFVANLMDPEPVRPLSAQQPQSHHQFMMPSSSSAVPTPAAAPSMQVPTVSPPNMNTPNMQAMNKMGTVEKIHKMLDKSYTSTATNTFNSALIDGTNIGTPRSNVWVVRYIDYTSKYGLGFLFNNGSAGVYFNDSTKIVLSADGKYFQYIERRKECSLGSEHSSQKYYIDAYPTDLQKKVTLLKHFRNYLLEEEAKNPRSMNHEQNADLQALKSAFSKDYQNETNNYNNQRTNIQDLDDEPELPFLKKWVKTKHAILFRISNRIVQVIFYDRSEVLLSSEAQIITYVNKTGERSEHALNDIMLAGRVDIAKRLKYTKDIMHRLIQSQITK